MAASAFNRRAFEDIVDVTFFANHVYMCPGQLECGQIVVKCRRFPAVGGMADAAILPKFAVVIVIFFVAGNTSAGRALEHVVDVAAFAFHFNVLACQLESGQIMIKGGGFPAGNLVTGGAVFPEFACVRIIF